MYKRNLSTNNISRQLFILTSIALPIESSAGDFIFVQGDYFLKLDRTRAKCMNIKEYKEFRHELKRLRNKRFKVIARVDRRGVKVITDYDGRQIKVSTMLLKNVSCFIEDTEWAYTDHTWLSADISKIVNNYSIKSGDHIEFHAIVNDYKYKFGMKQLGLIQLGKYFKIHK